MQGKKQYAEQLFKSFQLSQRVPEDNFYRIHRTHIVNKMFISIISGDSKLTLINGEQLQTSRRKKNIIKQMVAMMI